MQYQQPYGAVANAAYVNGNPATGTPGSIPPAAAIEHPQRELANFITKSGITPDAAKLNQLGQGIQLGKVNYAAAGGTATAITVTLDPVPEVYQAGMVIKVLIAQDSTGATTINVNGLGAKAIKQPDGTAIKAGDLKAGAIAQMIFDGTNFQLTGGLTAASAFLNYFMTHNQVVYNAGTVSFTVPAGVTELFVRLWAGGGGGGGANNSNYAGGGGGGEYREGWITGLTPGASISVTVGAGGAAGSTGGTSGGNGGTSSFGSYITCIGGIGGTGNISAWPGPGASPVAAGGGVGSNNGGSGGSMNWLGGNGGTPLGGWLSSLTIKGGNGGGTYAGAGGIGEWGQQGQVGAGPGAGGAGGSAAGTSTPQPGGAGQPGLCVITW